MEPTKMLRGALHIRVSHDEQALYGYSIEAQKEALIEYARQHNIQIVDIYIDEGKTARKKYTNRKEFMRMLNDVQAGKIDIILFTKLDRWFRNVRDYYKIQEILEKHKVDWRTIAEHYDTTTAAGRLHINIMLSVAQDEADRTSERIKFIFDNKVKNGEVISGSMSLGYQIKNKKQIIDPETAPAAQEVYYYYQKCQSKSATIVYIKNKYGIIIRHNSLTRILKNSVYKGEYKGNPKFCEALVDHETWNDVQEIQKKNVRVTKTHTIYVYTGLLRCPLCGRNLASAKTKTSENVYNIHYRCNGRYQDKHCTFNRMIGEKKIDEYLVTNMKYEVENYITQHNIALKSMPKTDTTKEINKIKTRLAKLKELYLEDLIDKNTYKSDYENFTARLTDLTEITEKPPSANIDALKSFLNKDLGLIYGDLSRPAKQMLWRSIIKKIEFDKTTLHPRVFFV